MSPLQPIEPVLGGVVDPDDLVGRRDELRRLERAVAHGGAYLVGDRRMGKTSVLRKARRELEASGHVVLYVSAETDTLRKFEDAVAEAIRAHPVLGPSWRTWRRSFEGEVTLGFLGQSLRLQGAASRGADPERDVFVLCARAAERAGAPSFVLIVDEVAQLAFHLAAQEPGAGAEFLRTLRRLRQAERPRTAIVLAGSVGLHHAVAEKDPLNDLPRIEIGPLPPAEAEELAQRLLLAVFGDPHPEVASRIAGAVAGIPYYIHSLVGTLDQRGADVASADVDGLVDQALDENTWDTDHYYDRIAKYYPGEESMVVAVLDELSHRGAATRDELAATLRNQFFEDPPGVAAVGEVLNRMRLDNYLTYADGDYRLETALLGRIWTRLRRRRG